LKINTIGRITSGSMQNWYIIIKDDSENTGGYLVIQSPNIDISSDGYDNWFEKIEEVVQYIQSNNIKIEWSLRLP